MRVAGKYAELETTRRNERKAGIFPLLVREKREVTDKTQIQTVGT